MWAGILAIWTVSERGGEIKPALLLVRVSPGLEFWIETPVVFCR